MRQGASTVPRDVQSRIKFLILKRYTEKKKVTLTCLMEALAATPALDEPATLVEGFPWSISSLYRTLRTMGFQCKKNLTTTMCVKKNQSLDSVSSIFALYVNCELRGEQFSTKTKLGLTRI